MAAKEIARWNLYGFVVSWGASLANHIIGKQSVLASYLSRGGFGSAARLTDASGAKLKILVWREGFYAKLLFSVGDAVRKVASQLGQIEFCKNIDRYDYGYCRGYGYCRAAFICTTYQLYI